MDDEPKHVAAASKPRREWPLFLIGVIFFFAGPILYAMQIGMRQLTTPWYIPALSTIGLLFLIAAVWKRRGILRIAATIPFVLLYIFIWIALFGTDTPEYRGPIARGRKFPTFTARLPDGSKFTNANLETGAPSVLVFFRGRW